MSIRRKWSEEELRGLVQECINDSRKFKSDDKILPVIPEKENKREFKAKKIVECFKEDFRMSLTDISRKTGIPISTIYEILEEIKKGWEIDLVRKKNKKILGGK